MLPPFSRPTVAPRWAALALAIWCTVGLNQAWWARLSQLAQEQSLSGTEQLWTALVLTAATFLWFMLLSWPGLRRIGWSVTLVTAAAVQYFMLHYGIVVDPSMVRNALQTNTSETMALMGSGLLLHVLLYAGLPMAVLWAGVRLQPGAAICGALPCLCWLASAWSGWGPSCCTSPWRPWCATTRKSAS
jgi:lipid A ethanolaminephosphotransferase